MDDTRETSSEYRQDLHSSFMQTITDGEMRDSVIDIAEIGLDRIIGNLQDETFGQVPLLKSFYAIAKTGVAVRDYFFLKKIFLFVSGFKDVDESFKILLSKKSSNSDYKEKLGQELVHALDLFDQISKASALFKVFSAYINGIISYDEFNRYSYVLQKINISDVKILRDFYILEKYHPKTGYYSSPPSNSNELIEDIRDNWHLLQGFIFVGLVSLSLGSTKPLSNKLSIPTTSPSKLKCNEFGGKFLQILDFLVFVD